jgi:hypothetical protein
MIAGGPRNLGGPFIADLLEDLICLAGSPAGSTRMEEPMRDMLNALYRECSVAPSPSPSQRHALAWAAYVLGSAGMLVCEVREACEGLRAAFENSPAAAN